MTKGLAALFILFSIFASSILSMIYGWGLTAENWFVIIAAHLWLIATQVILSALKDD